MKYYHETTKEERDSLIGKTYGELMDKYMQPEWCAYPDALYGFMGCMSLMNLTERINKDYCSDCPCCKK